MYQANLFSQDLSSVGFTQMANNNAIFWDDVISGKIAGQIKEIAYGETLSSSQSAYNMMKPIFAQEDDVERMFGIYMNRKNQMISLDLIARGSISGASVYPREIVKEILAKKATSLVLTHNHPSGDPAPSREDLSITKHVMFSLHCIGAQLLDHIIIGANGRYHSFADAGTLIAMRIDVQKAFEFNV
jgi:DNA repair protein RadC